MMSFYIHNIGYCLTFLEFCKMILIQKIKPKLQRINQCSAPFLDLKLHDVNDRFVLCYVKPDIVFTVWLGLGQIEFLREFLNFLYYNNFCSGVQSEEQNIHPTQY